MISCFEADQEIWDWTASKLAKSRRWGVDEDVKNSLGVWELQDTWPPGSRWIASKSGVALDHQLTRGTSLEFNKAPTTRRSKKRR